MFFFVGKYYRGAYSKLHRQSQEALELGRAHSGAAYRWLDDSLYRLVDATISIETKRYRAVFGLIDSYGVDEKTGEYWLSFSPKAKAAFDGRDTTYIDWERRLQIGRGQQLAKWLQNYVCGHKRGRQHTRNLPALYEWSGGVGRLRDFRSTGLPRALKELGRLDVITGGRIRKDDLVTWCRPEA